MFRNYLLVAFRNLIGNKIFSIINILGLSLGIACVILIGLYVVNESSYDRHWANAERTFRIMRSYTLTDGSGELNLATNAPQLGPLLKEEYPQFEHVVRLRNNIPVISLPESNQSFYEPGIYYADADVYEVFDIPMLFGNWENALTAPYQIVLSESLASKYFEEANPIGETLLFDGEFPHVVTGVMADVEQNSHMSPNAFVSMATRDERFGAETMIDWGNNDYHTYVVVSDSYNIEQFIDEIPDFIQRHIPSVPNATTDFSIIPLTDIHLRSHRDAEFGTNGNVTLVYAFSVIAFLILVIACFNFVNLSTARSITRAKEIGMRKVFGASRKQLVSQFMCESILLAFVAIVIAVEITDLALPWLNNLLNMDLSFTTTGGISKWMYLLLLALGIGIIAGAYPAIYMAEFSLSKVLKGELETGARGAWFRKTLVVLQFGISAVLIIASSIALNQIRYMLDLDLGLNTDRIVVYSGLSAASEGSYQTMKEELLRHPDVLSVTAANIMPSNQNTNLQGARIEGDGDLIRPMAPLTIDYDFFSTFNINILSGRDFSETNPADRYVGPTANNPRTSGAFILNESATRLLGWTPEEAIGRQFENVLEIDASITVTGPIVGVVEDVYFSSLREEVQPLFYRLANDDPSTFPDIRQMAVKLSGNNQQETIAFIERVWQQFVPGVPIVQSFLEQNYAGLYESEQRQGSAFSLFSIIAIVIAAMGLFGLASYLTERRTREIGIRKVLGSTVLGIVSLVSKDFCKLVLVANIIAWPVAWYLMNLWLQEFVYRTEIDPIVFIATAVTTLIIAFLTVGSLAAVTANKNPTIALGNE